MRELRGSPAPTIGDWLTGAADRWRGLWFHTGDRGPHIWDREGTEHVT